MVNNAPNNILKRVNQAWLDYKAKSGVTQAQAAKALGIGQSSFSQYLRGPDNGGIPLNTNFLLKFCRLINKNAVEFGICSGLDLQVPEAYSMAIRYTLSGAAVKDRYCHVRSIVPHRNCYAVMVDIEGFILHKGAIIIIDPDDDIHENDGVICRTGDGPVKVGQIVFADDGWRIISPVWGDFFAFKADKEDFVHRIVGNYSPEGKGRRFERKV